MTPTMVLAVVPFFVFLLGHTSECVLSDSKVRVALCKLCTGLDGTALLGGWSKSTAVPEIMNHLCSIAAMLRAYARETLSGDRRRRHPRSGGFRKRLAVEDVVTIENLCSQIGAPGVERLLKVEPEEPTEIDSFELCPRFLSFMNEEDESEDDTNEEDEPKDGANEEGEPEDGSESSSDSGFPEWCAPTIKPIAAKPGDRMDHTHTHTHTIGSHIYRACVMVFGKGLEGIGRGWRVGGEGGCMGDGRHYSVVYICPRRGARKQAAKSGTKTKNGTKTAGEGKERSKSGAKAPQKGKKLRVEADKNKKSSRRKLEYSRIYHKELKKTGLKHKARAAAQLAVRDL